MAKGDILDFKKKTLCICPRCRVQHFLKIEWTGRGTPRFNCPACAKCADVTGALRSKYIRVDHNNTGKRGAKS